MATGLGCDSVRDGLPEGCSSGNPIRVAQGGYFVPKGTTIPIANASDKSYLEGLVITKTLLPVHDIFNLEDSSIDEKVEESALGRKKKNHPGYRGYMWYFDYDLDKHQALTNWEGLNLDLIPYDSQGNIMYEKVDSTTLKGFGLSFFDVKKLPVASADNSEKTILELQETDTVAYSNKAYTNPLKNAAVADRFSPTNIKTISKVEITVGSVVVGVFTINIDLPSNAYIKDGAYDEKGVTGAVIANIQLLDAAGAAVTPTPTLTESTTTKGEYEVDASAASFTTGSIKYIPVVTDERFFESDVVTIT
jgi:hypothetical protein